VQGTIGYSAGERVDDARARRWSYRPILSAAHRSFRKSSVHAERLELDGIS
jgi:hypothetical protein